MPLYRYKAIAPTGTVVTGTLDASDSAALAQRLRGQGQFPVSVTPVEANFGLHRLLALLRPARRPSRRVLTTMTQELAVLLGAGLELDRALGMLGSLSELKPLHEAMAQVRDQVRDGASLADALARHDIFPPFYINLVRAGEMGGSLQPALARLADYLERSLAVRDAVISALIYPAVLLVTAGASVIVILVFVLPEFEPLFAESGQALPWAAQMLMFLSATLRGFWWLFVLIGAAAVGGARAAWRNAAYRAAIDRRLLRLPLLGELLRSIEVERFCRALGTLVVNGVALPVALKLCAGVMSNAQLRAAVDSAATGLREGESLSRRLAQSKTFPARTLDLIQVGEESGKLGEMLLRQADLDEQRIKHSLDRLLALLVPVLTILMGCLVAGLIASMLVAILSVNSLATQ